MSVLVYPLAPGTPRHEYLLLRRVPSRGGIWEGVTGSVEEGESLDSAAVREFIGATRLFPKALVPTHFSFAFVPSKRKQPHPAGGTPVTEHVFLAALEAKLDPTIDRAQHDAWAWFTFEEALGWLRWPESREALRRCETLVNKAWRHRS